ncbi:MAG: PIN domain-containing protein [Anaerolineales bacterium]|nr:PIN domain-containing protein [Anaerolineales bacterium]
MVKIFVDTSALFALVNTAEENHISAWDIWNDLIRRGDELITNNYVIVESIALTQNRLGMPVVQKLQTNTISLIQVVWIDEEQHVAALQNVLATNHCNLSLVDCSAFETMRRLGLDTVFTFDPHFAEQGFTVIP